MSENDIDSGSEESSSGGSPTGSPQVNRRRLVEYDAAWQHVVQRALDGFVASHDLLGKIARHPTRHVGPIRNVRTPQVLDQPREALEAAALIQKADLRACSVDAHTSFVAELATQHVSAMAKMFFRTVDKVTEAAGTTHDAAGQPLTWDAILDMLERMPVSFDRDGTPKPPVFVAHPDTLEKLAPITDAQRARQTEILRKKGEEHAAAKRTRRLPR